MSEDRGNRLEELIDAYLDDDAAERDVNELEALLRRDAPARRRFAARCKQETALYRIHARDQVHTAATAPVSVSWWTPAFRRGLAAAAVLVLLAGLGLWWSLGTRGTGVAEVESGTVLVAGAPAKQLPLDVAIDIPAPAVIALPDGSRAAFDQGTQLVLPKGVGARQTIAMQRGGGAFDVTRGRGQFKVETPAGTVTVLGTKFSVHLQGPPDAAIAVTVSEGLVRVDHSGGSTQLAAGQARTFPRDSQTVARGEGERRVALRRFTGEIQRVEGGTMTIAARGDAGEKRQVVRLTDETRVWLPPDPPAATQEGDRKPPLKAGSTAELRAEQRVTCEYTDDGAAVTIQILPRAARSERGEKESRPKP